MEKDNEKSKKALDCLGDFHQASGNVCPTEATFNEDSGSTSPPGHSPEVCDNARPFVGPSRPRLESTSSRETTRVTPTDADLETMQPLGISRSRRGTSKSSGDTTISEPEESPQQESTHSAQYGRHDQELEPHDASASDLIPGPDEFGPAPSSNFPETHSGADFVLYDSPTGPFGPTQGEFAFQQQYTGGHHQSLTTQSQYAQPSISAPQVSPWQSYPYDQTMPCNQPDPYVQLGSYAQPNPYIQSSLYVQQNPYVQSNPYAQSNPYLSSGSHAQPDPYIQSGSHTEQNPYVQPSSYAQLNPYVQPGSHVQPSAHVQQSQYTQTQHQPQYLRAQQATQTLTEQLGLQKSMPSQPAVASTAANDVPLARKAKFKCRGFAGCRMEFDTAEEANQHKIEHVGNRFRCPNCDATFLGETERGNHMRSAHLDESTRPRRGKVTDRYVDSAPSRRNSTITITENDTNAAFTSFGMRPIAVEELPIGTKVRFRAHWSSTKKTHVAADITVDE